MSPEKNGQQPDGEFRPEEEPELNAGLLKEARQEVETRASHLPDELSLPPDHPWGEAKLRHAQDVVRAVDSVLTATGQPDNPGLRELLHLLAVSHDLGRPVLGQLRQGGELPESYRSITAEVSENNTADVHHGHYSVGVLKAWNVLEQFDETTRQVIEYALGHHANPDSPTLPAQVSNAETFHILVTWLLRDADKLATFRTKTDKYLHDPEEKRRQVEANQLRGELSGIIPAGMLDRFERGEVLPRDECISYQAYILQYLSWIFDINHNQVLLLKDTTDTITKILDYFSRSNSLSKQECWRIHQKIRYYLTARVGGALPEIHRL